MKPVIVILLGLAVLAHAGCEQKKNDSPPPVNAVQMQRLTALRDSLQAAMGEKYGQPVLTATEAELRRGKELYPQLCAACHGERGDGRGVTGAALAAPPPSFSDPEQAAFFSEQARLEIIRKGVAGTAMMAWDNVLPESDILSLYFYIRLLKRRG